MDLNCADASDLILIPGISEKLAKKIIKYRDSKTSPMNLDELIIIPGIGKKRLKIIATYLKS